MSSFVTLQTYECFIIAAFTHFAVLNLYFVQLTFTAQLFEKLVLVKDKLGKVQSIGLFFTATGISIVIVIICAFCSPDDYKGLNFCLVTGQSFLYGSFGIGLMVIVLNFIIIVCIIYKIVEHAKFAKKSDQMAKIAASCITMLFVLNVFWIFGLFAIGEASIAFQYVFVLTNFLQGIISTYYFLLKSDWFRKSRLYISLNQTINSFISLTYSKMNNSKSQQSTSYINNENSGFYNIECKNLNNSKQ